MFEESLVESTALLRTRNRLPALLSLTTQCALAVLILSLPLLHPELIPFPYRTSISLAPPQIPTAPAQPVALPRLLARIAAAPTATAAVDALAETVDCACRNLNLTGPAVDAPTLSGINLANDAALPLGLASAPAGPHITVGVAQSGTKASLPRLSSGVSAGLLLTPIRPAYPQIAQAAHVEGTVVIDATISRTGRIEAASVLSGPTMLQAAALAAVREARYRPFYLNGQPTEVQTTITINFRLSS